MEASSPRWRQVTPSQHAWEAEALGSLRALLPDNAPFQAWTNFEFTDGGRIHEADALVVTPKGVYLIEIKSWSGKVTGDQGTWVQQRTDGSVKSYGNPARLNMTKVRSLASLLKNNWIAAPGAERVPYIESLVWFSNPSLSVALPPELRSHVAIADDNSTAKNIQTLTDAILTIGDEASLRPNFKRITAALADQFAATMERVGFKESTRTRTAGSYELQLPAFAERGSTQDFMAKHKMHGLQARVRIYSNVVGAGPDEAEALRDAATREFMATQNLPIDGVVRAIDSDLTEFGPAVIFEHHPKAVRLDRFMAERGDSLAVDDRLHIVEQLASTVREMHRRRITHRMLTPESVWLRPVATDVPGAERWDPVVSDFSLAAREQTAATSVATYTRVGSLPAARTGAVEVVLGDPAMETFLAPEGFTDNKADGVSLDVFSLGTLAYLLFAGQPPAESRAELRSVLGAGGLSLSAVVPGIDPQIEELVRRCTDPIVSDRLGDAAAVLDAVALVRASLAGESTSDGVDPLVAEEGDLLDGRFLVKRRLGKGSTAVALWCTDQSHERDVVLKVALGGVTDDRIPHEAEAIRNLRQENVVELYEDLAVGGRPTLVLSFAGDRSLAGYLRAEGAVSTEFLRRWGSDLLEAVRYLERAGVAHRDLKPDNLGIVEMGPHKKSHLVLFDFSLAGAPAADILAGTPPYLDPFLGDQGRGQFDLAAERYAAAVTIHEMATGETPVWGDGQTDPAYLPLDTAPTLLVEAIDPEVRSKVVEFLTKALSRRSEDRFDTGDDMARAWLDVFADWESSDHEEDEADDAGQHAAVLLPENLSLEDPISSLPSSRKVRSALRKVGAETIREVATLDAVSVNQARGVSVKTRRVVLRLRAAILERFADELVTATVASTSATGSTTEPADLPEPGGSAAHVPDARLDLDQLGALLVPPRGKRGSAGAVADTVRALLGLGELDGDDDWPTVGSVARQMDLTPGGVSASFQKARTHWAALPDLVAVTTDVLSLLAAMGGVAGVSELVDPLVEARGSGNDDADARRTARAVLRAVIEAASPFSEWFSVRRFGRRTLVAVNGEAVTEAETLPTGLDVELSHQLATFASIPLLDLAVALGRRADELVGPLTMVPSSDAVPALRSVRSAAGRSLSDARLVRLAAAASDFAITNAASDLVPVGIPPVEAVRWSRTSLVGAAQLSERDVIARVGARFPGVVIPTRPELDGLLTAAGLPYEWSDERQTYVSNAEAPGGVGPFTRVASRHRTVVAPGGATLPPGDPEDPAIVAALEIDDRLHRSITEGGFLALRAPTDRLAGVQQGLARFQTGTPPMTYIDLEARFLHNLRAAAADKNVKWTNLELADDRNGANWSKLSALSSLAVDTTIAEVAGLDRAIAWFPGVLVRHAGIGLAGPLDRLRDATTSFDHPLTTLWLVVLGSTTEALPTVDGTPVPALAGSQWLDLTPTWLSNDHRAGDLSA
jgi:serine/threonine protein kinase